MRPGVHGANGERSGGRPRGLIRGLNERVHRGLGGGGPPVAGRGAARALSGGLAGRPGAGPVGVEPRASPPGWAPSRSLVLPGPSVVGREGLSCSRPTSKWTPHLSHLWKGAEPLTGALPLWCHSHCFPKGLPGELHVPPAPGWLQHCSQNTWRGHSQQAAPILEGKRGNRGTQLYLS